jgi:spermidine synthase
VLSVIDVQPENYLALRHGKIVHGFQFEDAARRSLPTGYYGENSAANIVIRHWPHHPMRVGLVGMGTGTLASIGQPGDVYRFYEINPDVYRSSEGTPSYFSFLKDSRAQIEVVLGDARGSLEREAQQENLQKFDVLILDAFSSDAIPTHLLTFEAFQVFTEHMRGPESVIAVHISNRTLDLGPVVVGVAREFGLSAVRNISLPSKSYLWESDWVLLSHNDASLDLPELKPGNVPFAAGMKPILWTDDYSNLWRVIRQPVITMSLR